MFVDLELVLLEIVDLEEPWIEWLHVIKRLTLLMVNKPFVS